MNNYLIVNSFGFSYLVRYSGHLNLEQLHDMLDSYMGDDDTDEEIIDNVLTDMGVEHEMLPASVVDW